MAGHGCKSPLHACSAATLDLHAWLPFVFFDRFILEGLATFVCVIPAWWLIPDFPEDGRILRGIDQKRWLHRLQENQGVINASIPFSMKQVRAAFSEWKTYVYALM